MEQDPELVAAWMVARIHHLGRRSRDDLLADIVAEFGPRDGLDRALMNAFRAQHRGTLRWIPNGAVWESTLPVSVSRYAPEPEPEPEPPVSTFS